MKKFLILVLLMSFLLCSCSVNFSDLKKEFSDLKKNVNIEPKNKNRVSTSQGRIDITQEIIESFINKDSETLFSLLSEDSKINEKDAQFIQKKLNSIDGNIISYDEPFFGGPSGAEFRDGKTTYKSYGANIRNIKTDTNNIYSFTVHFITIDSDKPENVGVDLINIFSYDSNGDIVTDNRGFAAVYASIG